MCFIITRAPEVIAKKEYSFEVDWWCIGILIHDMLVGGSPFSSESKEKVSQKILRGRYTLPSYLSNSAKNIIKVFLVAEPSARLGAKDTDDIKRHRFFRDMNWDKLYERKIPPPFVPPINHDFDVSMFDPKVVEEPLQLVEVQYINRDPDAFLDFSYAAPFAVEVELTETWMLCEERFILLF